MKREFDPEIKVVKDVSQEVIIENRRKARKLLLDQVNEKSILAKKALEDLSRFFT